MKANTQLAVIHTHENAEPATGTQSRRMPWAAVHAELIQQSGGTLLAWLFHEANLRGHTLSELAAALNVTYGYLSQLRGGVRHLRHISDSFAESCAAYLVCPAVLVKLAAGRIKPSDWTMPNERTADSLKSALRKIQADPIFGALLPAGVFSATEDMQRFIVLCYQEASGQEVYPYRALPDMLCQLLRAAEEFEGTRRTLKAGKDGVQHN